MSPTPIYQLRMQAIVVSPAMDASTPLDANSVSELVAGVNRYYAQAGITFLFDPAKDYEFESNSPLADDGEILGLHQARAASYQGKVVVFFRAASGGFSGPGPYALCLIAGVDGAFMRHVSHELGHYFGLQHTHRPGWRLTRALSNGKPNDGLNYVEDLVATEVQSFNHSSAQSLEQFVRRVIDGACDGDSADKNVTNPVDDTLPAIEEWPPNARDSSGMPLDECGGGAITFTIDTVPGLTAEFSFMPDRTNLMSYFSCGDASPHPTKTFSPGQIDVMRSVIVTGRNGYDRRHLLGPALRWSGWSGVPGGGLTTTAVAATGFGQLVVIAKGQGPGIFRNQAALGGTTLAWGSSWRELEGNGRTDRAPAMTAFAGKLHAFVVGPAGHIFHNFANQGQDLVFQPSWSEVPGNGLAGGAPACTVFDDKLYTFVAGPTGHVFHNFAGPGQPFQSQWSEVPGNGVARGTPACTVFDNHLYLFVTSPTGRIFHNFAGAGQSFQSQWFEVPGNATSITSPAAVAAGEYLYIFIVGGDHRLYMSWAKAGSPFGFWMEVPPGGGLTDQAPAVAFWNGQLYLFAKGQGDGRIFVTSATPS